MIRRIMPGVPALSVPVLMFGAFFLYSLVSITLGSPILGSDEYAYLINGKYYARLAEIYQLDEWIQHVPNVLYLKSLHVANRLFGADFVPSYRILHAAEYVLTDCILFRL